MNNDINILHRQNNVFYIAEKKLNIIFLVRNPGFLFVD